MQALRTNRYNIVAVAGAQVSGFMPTGLSGNTNMDLCVAVRMCVYRLQVLHGKYLLKILHETRLALKQLPNVTKLSVKKMKQLTVVGDLHGQLDDLLTIFYKASSLLCC